MPEKKQVQSCTFHPMYAATGRCVKCGRPFCNICLEKVKGLVGERCIECLTHEELSKRTGIKRMLALYIAGFAASVAIVMNGLQTQYPPILQMVMAPNLSFFIFYQWYTQGRTPIEMVYMAFAAMGGFVAFAVIDVLGTRKTRQNLLRHGFCPSCGKVLFGNTVCPNCGKTLPEKPPDYPDVEWLREYLKMEKKRAVSPALIREKEKKLRTKYKRRRVRRVERS